MTSSLGLFQSVLHRFWKAAFVRICAEVTEALRTATMVLVQLEKERSTRDEIYGTDFLVSPILYVLNLGFSNMSEISPHMCLLTRRRCGDRGSPDSPQERHLLSALPATACSGGKNVHNQSSADSMRMDR